MMMYDINLLNRLSHTLCEAVNEHERREAEETLAKLVDSKDCLQTCSLLLEQGEQPFAQVVATGALKKLLNKKINLNIHDRLQLRNYLLKYLEERPNLMKMPYVLNPLCKLFATLTKVGWLEKDPQTVNLPYQMPVELLRTAAKEPTSQGLLALKLLNALVEEINSDEGLESISKQRKISSDFRDNHLLEIFIISLDILKSALGKQLDEMHLLCVSQALDLSYACTNYDFIGSMNDDTLDENVNIQMPTRWRPVLLERQVVLLLFDLYFSLPSEYVTKAFQTLVQLSSVRRMLFDSLDRQRYLEQIVTGLKRVLENPDKLGVPPDNFHHFCRIISRVKANYQVSELVKCSDFGSLLNLLTEFTLQSLRLGHLFTLNSIFYLVSFWSRLAGSLSYARVDVEAISNCIPKVCLAFIESRMLLCEKVVCEGADDPLEDMGTVKQLMELFTIISRKDYKQTVKDLIGKFDESINAIFSQSTSAEDQQIARKRIIWLITMMAAGVNGKTSSNNSEVDDDLYDGEVVSRVWKTMQLTDQRLEQEQSVIMDAQLEFAYIYLMEEFRKTYISDQIQRESQVYDKLAELGVTDDAGVLRLFAKKIITNLKFWGKEEKILSSTLNLLNDLTVGYANVRRLLKTEEIQLLLRNHSAFEFVALSNNIAIMRTRTNFYSSLMRLLNIELEDDTSIFVEFIAPITEKFKNIYTIFHSGSVNSTNEAQLRMAVIGFVRDLRGIASACTKKSNYQLFLNWALPNAFVIMEESVKLWPSVADVTTPILKLIAEMTMNRQSRLTADMHSCLAVILFRLVSKVLCEYGDRMLALPPVSKELHYKERVKNVGVICQILRHVLSGNYLPYGVFWIYGDNCLNDALDVAFKMFLRLQEENFLTYFKLSQCIYYFLDVVTRDSMAFVSKLDEQIFIAILRAVHRGIHSDEAFKVTTTPSGGGGFCNNVCTNTTVISSSCTVLDQILDYVFDRLTLPPDVSIGFCAREPEGDKWKSALEKEPEILHELLTSILSQLLFEEVKCQWSMSRPLLGLIILNARTGRYEACKNEFILQQPTSLQPLLHQAFVRLMEGIRDDNVTLKNKDNFTQNLSSFRKEVESVLKGNSMGNTTSNASEQEFTDNMTD